MVYGFDCAMGWYTGKRERHGDLRNSTRRGILISIEAVFETPIKKAISLPDNKYIFFGPINCHIFS